MLSTKPSEALGRNTILPLPTIQLTQRPGIIDLGWGHPDSALLPAAELRQAAGAALERWGADALAYGADRGPGPLVEWLCRRIGRSMGARQPTTKL